MSGEEPLLQHGADVLARHRLDHGAGEHVVQVAVGRPLPRRGHWWEVTGGGEGVGQGDGAALLEQVEVRRLLLGGLVGVAEAGEAAGLVQQVAHGDVRATGPVDVVAERVVEVEVHGVVRGEQHEGGRDEGLGDAGDVEGVLPPRRPATVGGGLPGGDHQGLLVAHPPGDDPTVRPGLRHQVVGEGLELRLGDGPGRRRRGGRGGDGGRPGRRLVRPIVIPARTAPRDEERRNGQPDHRPRSASHRPSSEAGGYGG